MSAITQKVNVFLLNTKSTSYALGIDHSGLVRELYWGRRVSSIDDFMNHPIMVSSEEAAKKTVPVTFFPDLCGEECSSFGGMRFKETSLKVCFADGVRDFRYRVAGTAVEGNHLTITLEDVHYAFRVQLHYQVFADEDIIKKWRVAENYGDETIRLERFHSAEYTIKGSEYESINCVGKWGKELNAVSEPVNSGKKVYESLFGLSGQNASPYFIVHKDADECTGEVYYGALEYSGSFKIVVEATPHDYVSVLAGISDTDFIWNLKAGSSFTTPTVYSGYSCTGFETMSNTLSAFSRKHLMPKAFADKVLPVLYNSWYATFFDVTVEEQVKLAERAAEIGVELFVIDDGWFRGRNHDKAGLGDWFVDQAKFPQGLNPVIERVNELGMQFGIWIEPEMTNPDSDLYRAHPDWVYRYETREIIQGRHQYMLDMSNPEVVGFLAQCFDDLLSEYHIAYIKWDMNRFIAEMASVYQDQSEYRSMWYRHVEGVYALIRALREKHPHVEFEACASGGGRVDYGAMRYFDEYWPSDNTDPLDRLFIHENYSLMYPVKYMRAWHTDDFPMNHRVIPLEFSMHCAMCGVLGIGTNLNETSEEARKETAALVQEYKEIRETVQLGAVYRLKSLKRDAIQAVEYLDENQAVVFAFLDRGYYGNQTYPVRLRGLEEDANYICSLKGETFVKSGAFLMHAGLDLELEGDYSSLILKVRKTGKADAE